MAKFNINVQRLIESVKARPCLWDKTSLAMRDRFKRSQAWTEICEILQEDYQNMDSEEQKELNDAVVKKWHHVRDAFLKSVRKRANNPESKEYIHHRRLQFLMKVIDGIEPKPGEDVQEAAEFITATPNQEDEVTQLAYHRSSNVNKNSAENGASDDDERDTKSDIDLNLPDCIEPPSKVRKLDEDMTLNSSTSSEQGPSEKATLNGDEAFFISISKNVKSMTEDQKIDFKIGVLNLIKHIRNN